MNTSNLVARVLLLLASLTASGVSAQTQWSKVRVSVATNGTQAAESAQSGSLSSDGRFAVFSSRDETLAPGYTNSLDFSFQFVRDIEASITDWVSLPTSVSRFPTNAIVTHDGGRVYFLSTETTLAPVSNPGQAARRLYVRNLISGDVSLVADVASGTCGGLEAVDPSASSDGRYLALAAPSCFFRADGDSQVNTWVLDTQGSSVLLASRDIAGVPIGSYSGRAISGDGRWLAFWSPFQVRGLGPSGLNPKLYVMDLQEETVEYVNLPDSSSHEAQWSTPRLSISNGGRHVIFVSAASGIVPEDSNGVGDIFLVDRDTQTITRISLGVNGEQLPSRTGNFAPTPDARRVVYTIESTQQVIAYDRHTGFRTVVADRPLGNVALAASGQYMLVALDDADIGGVNNGIPDVVRIDLSPLDALFRNGFEN